MADFMTVLAASQKLTPGGAHGKALAGLLPEGLFGNVLSARLGAATDTQELAQELLPALPMALPQASSEQITLAEPTPVRKPAQNSDAATATATATAVAVAVADQTAGSVLIPPALTAPVETDKAAAAVASEEGEDEPPATPRVMRDGRTRVAPEMAATPAAATVGQRQELPLTQPLQGAGTLQTGVRTEGAVELSPLQAATAAPLESLKSPDASTAAAARQLGQFEHAARTAEVPVRATVESSVRSQTFPAEFSEKIVWLAGRQSQVADLSLNPPQLGSLEVRLSLSGGEAGAQFYSPHPLVRDAIEAALPKLREMMAQAGIALGDAQVRDEAFSRGEAGGKAARAGSGETGDAGVASLAHTSVGASRSGQGLIDLYA